MAYGIGISLPNLVYLYMAYTMPESIVVVNVCVAVEQFGYGFGFTAYTMYLMLSPKGNIRLRIMRSVPVSWR